MKITIKQLQRLIKEEIEKTLEEDKLGIHSQQGVASATAAANSELSRIPNILLNLGRVEEANAAIKQLQQLSRILKMSNDKMLERYKVEVDALIGSLQMDASDDNRAIVKSEYVSEIENLSKMMPRVREKLSLNRN